MKVTEVNVRKMFDEGILKAVVSVTFDDCFVVHDIKVVDTGEKKMVVMPSVKTANGRFRDTVHPMTSEFRKHRRKGRDEDEAGGISKGGQIRTHSQLYNLK